MEAPTLSASWGPSHLLRGTPLPLSSSPPPLITAVAPSGGPREHDTLLPELMESVERLRVEHQLQDDRPRMTGDAPGHLHECPANRGDRLQLVHAGGHHYEASMRGSRRRSRCTGWGYCSLGISLKTTNCIESLLLQVRAYTDKIDRWRTSERKHRWVARVWLSIEPRLHRIKGYQHLPLLREALQREIASNAQRCENVA